MTAPGFVTTIRPMAKNTAPEVGRPTIADEAAEELLQLRITRKAKRELRASAKKDGVSMSEVVRRALVKAKVISE